MDISLNDEGGPRAADMLRQQVQARPALRPLLFVLKALLKKHGLNDVSTGGLGSFALANMVVAYLQEAEKVRCYAGRCCAVQRFVLGYGCHCCKCSKGATGKQGCLVLLVRLLCCDRWLRL